MMNKDFFADASPGRVCRKCLLRDMPGQAYFESLENYIERLDSDLKVAPDVYERRLGLCRDCDNLMEGMCRICGCFVELRAVMKKNGCPKVHPEWYPENESGGQVP